MTHPDFFLKKMGPKVRDYSEHIRYTYILEPQSILIIYAYTSDIFGRCLKQL